MLSTNPNKSIADKLQKMKDQDLAYPLFETGVNLRPGKDGEEIGGHRLIFTCREKANYSIMDNQLGNLVSAQSSNKQSVGNGGGNSRRSSDGTISIALFIPPNSLNYSRTLNYSGPEAEDFTKGLFEAGLDFLGGQNLKGAAQSGGTKSLLRASAAAASQISGLNQALGSKGYAYNPNMEIYFQNVGFRTFSFTFPFLPKTQKEAKNVKIITSIFEKYSLPIITPGKLLFKYPNIWKICTDGPGVSGDKPWFETKDCVLTSIDISHGAESGYTTFKDGLPVMTTLKLSFMEIEIYGQDDIHVQNLESQQEEPQKNVNEKDPNNQQNSDT